MSAQHISFAAPLSTLTHNAFSTAPAQSWIAAGEPGRVYFLARTDHDWRLATLQAAHELIEAALHHHAGVTQSDIDAADAFALVSGHPARDIAHSCGAAIETSLALALGVLHGDFARLSRGPLRDPTISRILIREAP